MEIVLLIIGVLFIAFGMILNASNIQSKLVFKVFPLFSGVYVAGYAIMQLGWITLNV